MVKNKNQNKTLFRNANTQSSERTSFSYLGWRGNKTLIGPEKHPSVRHSEERQRVVDKIQLVVPPLLSVGDVSLKHVLTVPAHVVVLRVE